MVQLPAVGFQKELFFVHLYAVSLCQLTDDLLEFLLGRFSKIYGDAEPCHKGKFLLHRVVCVQLFVSLLLVPEALPDQMAAVRGGVDEHIVRLSLQSALDDRLQVFVFDFKLLEGEVVHVDDKFIIPVLDLGDDIVEVLELMLVHLDHPKALVIVFIEDSLDGGGFPGSRVPEEKAVVGPAPLHKGLCVVNEFFLGALIPHQLVKLYMGDLCDRHNVDALLVVSHPESLVKAQLAYAELLVELGHGSLELLRVLCLPQAFRQSADPVPDTAVEHTAVGARSCVVQDHGDAVHAKPCLHRREVVVKQLLEDSEVVEGHLVDASPCLSHDLAGSAVGVLIVCQEKGQVIVPEISLKAVVHTELQYAACARKEKAFQVLLVVIFIIVVFHQERHVI